ncbi:MAG: ComEC/Rec2 family competence protein, partial [Pseudolysinimonas sp.]
MTRPAVAALPARLRLLPVALLAWLAAGIAIGIPDAALPSAIIAALVAGGLSIAARRVRVLILPALCIAGAALVLAAVAFEAPGRAPADLAAAAHGGRSVELLVVVGGRTVEGRFAGVISGASVPVLVFGDAFDVGPAIGSTVSLRATLQKADAGEDVSFLAYPKSAIEVIAGAPPLLAWADDIRAGFVEISRQLPDPGGGLLPGLAIGETSRVPEALDSAMKVSSLSHLTAVSGANCAIVVGAVFALMSRTRAPRIVRIAVAAAALLGFVVLVTPEPSVLRAAVMAALALAALAAGRPALGMPVLCVAVLVLLITDPWLARSYGFALSALATAGLLMLAGPLAKVLGRVLPGWLATVIAVPSAAQLACQPVLLLLAPSLPIYGIPANLLAEPAAPLATVLGLVACLVGALSPPLGSAIAWLGWLPASWIAAVATLFAGLPGARSPWPGGGVGVALLCLVEVAALVALFGARRSRRVARLVCAVAVVAYFASSIGATVVSRVSRPADWEYAMCDVGQGDATLVRSGDHFAAVDVGRDPALMRACLDDLGISRLDLVVLTHFDLDHVGGSDAVIGRTDRVLVGVVSEPKQEALVQRFAAAGAEVVRTEIGDQGTLGDLTWDVLWPPKHGTEPGNPSSVTLWWSCASGCLS